MAEAYISGLDEAEPLTGDELVEVSQLSATILISEATISALASDNAYLDSADGFLAAGFAVGDRVNVAGFTGDTANNLFVATITDLLADKMTIGGTEGDAIVDDAEGETVTITKWVTRRTTSGEMAAAAAPPGGVQSIPVLAAAMTPSTTNGAASNTTETTTNDVMLPTLDFDSTTQEHAQFLFPMPKSWDEGTLTAQFIWTADSGSGDCIWGIQAVAMSEGDALDAAWGTAEEVTDSLTTAGDQHSSSWTDPITPGGSPVEGDVVAFRVYRKAADGADTLDGVDARLIGIRLNYTTDAADDS
jgi:hypothetical protein